MLALTAEEWRIIAAIVRLLILPAVGFVAGFVTKFYLQDRKSRDELLRALAPDRAAAFQALWQKIALPEEIRGLARTDDVPKEYLQTLNEELLHWYHDHAHALFLSWKSTKCLFLVFDLIRDEKAVTKGVLDRRLSKVRTSLKRDCGIYTSWNAWRQLPSPRQSGKTAKTP